MRKFAILKGVRRHGYVADSGKLKKTHDFTNHHSPAAKPRSGGTLIRGTTCQTRDTPSVRRWRSCSTAISARTRSIAGALHCCWVGAGSTPQRRARSLSRAIGPEVVPGSDQHPRRLPPLPNTTALRYVDVFIAHAVDPLDCRCSAPRLALQNLSMAEVCSACASWA